MSHLEFLEGRLFMSATPAQVASGVKVIKTQESLVNADLKHLDKAGKADFAVITADVKRLKAAKTEASLGRAANSDAKSLVSGLEKTQSAGATLINKDVAKLLADEKKLAKNSTDAGLQANVSADNAQLTTDANAVLAKLSAAADTTAVNNDLNAVAAANSSDAKTGTDVAAAESDIEINLGTARNDANTLYTTDVTGFENLFA